MPSRPTDVGSTEREARRDVMEDGAKLTYSIDEAAHQLSISRPTLYRLIAGGELVSIRIGNRRLVPRSAIEVLIQRKLDEGAA